MNTVDTGKPVPFERIKEAFDAIEKEKAELNKFFLEMLSPMEEKLRFFKTERALLMIEGEEPGSKLSSKKKKIVRELTRRINLLEKVIAAVKKLR